MSGRPTSGLPAGMFAWGGPRSVSDHEDLLDSLDVMAFVTDREGGLVFLNRAWREFTGCEPDDVECACLERIAPEDRPAFQHLLDEAISRAAARDGDFQMMRADGQYRWVTCFAGPYRDETGRVAGLLGMCADMTERRQREEQMAFMAMHDSLTGLPNRRMFVSSLERAVQRARRGFAAVLLLIDVDRFKEFNDRRGHLEGDQALINFALLLQRHVRAGDLLARIGGDEFAVLFEGTSMHEADSIAERMRRAAASEDFVEHARAHDLTMSGGLVPIDGTIEARAVFDLADVAMYSAKEAGRNRIVQSAPREGMPEREDGVASRVRDAIAQRRFVLHFQPVLDLTDRSVAYYESLLRMTLADGSVIAPSEFLPVVERLGLMPRMSRIVVSMALSALARHPRARVAVNLSAADLVDESFPRFIDEEMHRLGVEPRRFVIELTEGAVMGNLAAARSWTDRLGRRGCVFVLDDFGSGLGLFGLLKDLPFEQVKLDGSLIASLANNGREMAFVEAVRSLIESQGRTAVASWVESAESLARVRKAGFALGQGYHLEMPTADLAALVERYG